MARRKEPIMIDINFVLLYVESPERSAAFYADLFGRPAIEASPTFAMFAMSSGVMLGLWGRAGVQPAANAPGGGEIAFAVDSDEAVDARFAEWRDRGLPIAQTPTPMDFGRTFVALDPDGHRLRVFAPARD
jgi:catechol 2,3-dioxygenase-like lactoylglutathione lyase family enzyme